MQPSTIILNKELAELREELKTSKNKEGVKARIKEIEALLNPKQVTDVPNVDLEGSI